MKIVLKPALMISTILIALILLALFFPTWTPRIKGENSISVLEHVELNGTKQEIMIRGNDRNNPVILNVHGGPGASEIPFAKKMQDLLETKFTIVNYDQRASGKSYHFSEDYSNLSSDLLVKDLLAVTDYITERLEKEKIILIGHSYGTYLATQAASRAPEKYEAYIGIGQMGDTVESEIDALHYVLEQAGQEGNAEDAAQLQQLQEAIENGGALTPRGYVNKYGGASRLTKIPDATLVNLTFTSEYNLLDAIRYNKGMNQSQGILIEEVFKHPLPTLVNKLDLPVYFVMGDYDFMTSSQAARHYFDSIEAEHKEFLPYAESAHYPQYEEKERFVRWMSDTFLD
ncbi:alpha/beta hydrolase [Paenibacillus sp. BIHB 4019]|uniref:Alpha/beta hydrolase n=1 Tax=Paenibacillus sp. BIHB 4019 TaxID=1870819 RepID=A0A1B2DG28_9BACL|nr:alpha/beta hydrolase [Paenibacillus sp. BIHB 4019]ANY66656.1 alpha/beta hydrolase [Paenibacillus sp. BIHB 4019]